MKRSKSEYCEYWSILQCRIRQERWSRGQAAAPPQYRAPHSTIALS